MIARIKYLLEGLEDNYKTMSKDSNWRQKKINEKGHAGVNTAGDTYNLKEFQKKSKQNSKEEICKVLSFKRARVEEHKF